MAMTHFHYPQPSLGNQGISDINIRNLLKTLYNKKWLIIMITALAVIAGYFHASSKPRVYKTDALVQIEHNSSMQALLETMAVGNQASNPVSAELEILQSRTVMGSTVERLNLDIQIEPRRLPWLGNFLVNHGLGHDGFHHLTAGLIDRLPGVNSLSAYVWAGEVLQVARFEVPENHLNQFHVLQATEANGFKLLRAGETVLKGHVGETVQDEAAGYRIFVSRLEAHPGAEFLVRRVSPLNAISQLQRRFTYEPRGKDSGIYRLSLVGTDRERIQPTLEMLTGVFLAQNVQRQSEEAEKQIAFLNEQIPLVNAQLAQAEDLLNDYRSQRDSVDLTYQTENLLRQLVSVDNQLVELDIVESDLAERFRPSHPNYQALLRQRAFRQAQLEQLNSQVNELPATQQEILTLTRDVQVSQQLYTQLLSQLQEMRLVKAGTVGNVRVLDAAVLFPGAIAPRISLTTLISGLLGAILATIFVLVRQLLSQAIKSPSQLEELGLPVYASLPFSGKQTEYGRSARSRPISKRRASKSGLLALDAPADFAVEALRVLRTSLYFAMLEAGNNRLMITGATLGAGKSFVAANLAAVCAQAGQKVLLIDADMRRGRLHHAFNGKSEGGLSELLAQRLSPEEVVRHTAVAGLDYVARGTVPPNPSELLMHRRFHEFLMAMSERYELVMMDTPPVLAVTDAAVVGKLAGTGLMVVRFDRNPPGEIKAAKQRLESGGVRLKGAILNGVEKSACNQYYGNYLYAYPVTEHADTTA